MTRSPTPAALLPHRGLMLLATQIDSLKPGRMIQAHLDIAENDPCFAGTAPENAFYPPTLLLEFAGQCAAMVCASCPPEGEPVTGVPMLASARGVKFHRRVPPGRTVDARVQVMHRSAGATFVSADLTDDTRPVATIRQALLVHDTPQFTAPRKVSATS